MTPPAPPSRTLLTEIDAAEVRSRLDTLRELLDAAANQAGRDRGPEILVASKYFDPSVMPDLIFAGATLLGENRAEVIEEKQQAAGDLAARWDFIGELQSRKVAAIAPLVSRIHTVAGDSAARKLQALAQAQAQGGDVGVPDLLVQVNVAGEVGKGGVAPDALPALLDALGGLPVKGLMTMPPLAGAPADSRRWFAALRELAATHGLADLSMGTSQDAVVAAQEGATVVRIGGILTGGAAWERLLAAHA